MARLSFTKPYNLTTDENSLAERLKASVTAAHDDAPFTTTTMVHAHLSSEQNPRLKLDTNNTACKVVLTARHTWDEDKTILTIELA